MIIELWQMLLPLGLMLLPLMLFFDYLLADVIAK